jgi:alkylation response protein AidB-like acyl-CoA dehydrogenase
MDLTLTSDQEHLLGAIVDCLQGELPLARLHQPEAARNAAEIARMRMLAELGWSRVSLPADLGGAGLGMAEEVLLFREFGRRLAPASILAMVLGGRIAALGGASGLADEILSGHRIVAFATPEAPVTIGETASGPVRMFSTGPADLALLVTPGGAALLDMSGAPSDPRPCLDRSITMRSADLASAQVLVRADGPQTWSQGLLLLAATLTGQAEASRDMITEYAKIRHTFGRPIGSYQAVRHPIAEMAIRCEQSKCLVLYAALSLDEERLDAGTQAAGARAIAQVAASRNDDANIQLHGGIGVTDDLDAHLYMKRTNVYANWFGGARHQLKALLDAPLGDI